MSFSLRPPPQIRPRMIPVLDPNSGGPEKRLLGLADALVVARRYTPVIGAPRRPLPVFGTADLVVVADLRDLGGVFHHAAVRADEVAEHVVARPVASRAPHGRIARVTQAADAAHDSVDVRHIEGDVIERREAGARVGDAVVHAVAAHEAHVARAVGQLEAEALRREALRRIDVRGIEHHMRELDRFVAAGGQGRHRLLDDEAIRLALGSVHLARLADFARRAAEGDAADRGLAALEADEVGEARRAAQLHAGALRHARQPPDVGKKARRAFDIGDAQLDALQFDRHGAYYGLEEEGTHDHATTFAPRVPARGSRTRHAADHCAGLWAAEEEAAGAR